MSGAAAGGVGDDGVHAADFDGGEGAKIFARQVASDVANPGMRGERAAAKLLRWYDDLASVGGQYADGGGVQFGEGDVGDASGEKRYTSAALAGWGKYLAEPIKEKMIIHARQQKLALGEAEKFQDAGGTGEGLQSGPLVKTQQARRGGNAARVRQQAAINDVASDPRQQRTLVVALDARSRVLDELSIFNAGRARRFARAAVETFIDVIDERIGDRNITLFHVNHLMNSAAR